MLLPPSYLPVHPPPPVKPPRFPQADDQAWVALARPLLLYIVSAGDKGVSWKQLHVWRKTEPRGKRRSGTLLRNCIAWLEDCNLAWYRYVGGKLRWFAKEGRSIRLVSKQA